jgi:DNA ligase-1
MKQQKIPHLYNKTSNGKIQIWSISVYEEDSKGVIEIQRGFIDGKIQTQKQIISKGKNIGKKNETTPYTQALAEAKSKWNTKKTKTGYSENIKENTETNQNNTNINPMLAKDFNKDSNKLKWEEGIVWQPKLDGVRAIIGFQNNNIFIKSRGNKFYQNLNHIKNILKELYINGTIQQNILIDCELYTNLLSFEEITGICRKQKELNKDYKEKELKIKAHIFDIIDTNLPNLTFEQRYMYLQNMFVKLPKEIILVKTEDILSADYLNEIHDKATEEGYEGIMLRNKQGIYKQGPTRSNDLIKMKKMIDDEFEIVNFKEGVGLEKETVIWSCKTKDGNIFYVRPTGTRKQRKIWFNDGDNYIGKFLTVQFQELSKDKVPRFPVGIEIRDYE